MARVISLVRLTDNYASHTCYRSAMFYETGAQGIYLVRNIIAIFDKDWATFDLVSVLHQQRPAPVKKRIEQMMGHKSPIILSNPVKISAAEQILIR